MVSLPRCSLYSATIAPFLGLVREEEDKEEEHP